MSMLRGEIGYRPSHSVCRGHIAIFKLVTGNGLGQDLQKPVAYVMARRRGQRARFVTLLAPYGRPESIRGFRQVDPRTVVVCGAGWEDTIVFGESGVRCTRQPPAVTP